VVVVGGSHLQQLSSCIPEISSSCCWQFREKKFHLESLAAAATGLLCSRIDKKERHSSAAATTSSRSFVRVSMTTTTTTTTTAATTGAAACMGTSTCEAVEEWQDIKEEQPVAAAEQQQSSWLPPGFRFHPTDEELVSYYLAKKVRNGSFAGHAIAEVDLNKCEPWDLPGTQPLSCSSWDTLSSHSCCSS